MSDSVKTSVAELEDSRVRIEVEVEPGEVEKGIERTARQLAGEMKVPGFRKGKVPAQMVIQRIGREAVIEETLRASLPDWYERALLASGVNPVGDPKLDVPSMPDAGEPLAFSIEVAVRPEAKLGDYRGLEVGRAEPEVPDEAVDAELERLREGFASLKPVEREAGEGDYLLIDYKAMADGEPIEGAEARDFLLELGAEGMLEGFDEALGGAKAGEERTAEISFPDGLPARAARGQRRELRDRGQGGAREAAARHRTTTSHPRRRSSTRSRSCGRTSRKRSVRHWIARPARLSARPPWTPPWSAPRSPSPRTSSPPARPRCGSASSARWRRAGSRPRATSRCRTARART